MSPNKIIRAWKDVQFRQSLSNEEIAMLPEHPAGLIDLTDTELDAVAGGKAGENPTYFTLGTCGWRCFTTTTRQCGP